MVSHWTQCVLPIATHHNLYAIINVVMAFVAIENAMLVVHRIRVIPVLFKESKPIGVNNHASEAMVVTGSA